MSIGGNQNCKAADYFVLCII